MPESMANRLISGRLLARNTIFNFIGQGVPLIVAVFVIPLLVKGLGTDRFGVLSLVWMVIGYFSVFDLGLSRALTKLVSEKLGTGREKEIPPLIWTSLFLMIILGLVGMIFVLLLSSWLVQDILKIPKDIQPETLKSFYLLAVSVPVVIITTGLGGILVARQYFGLLNAVRIPMGILTFLGPLLILSYSKNIFFIVLVLLIVRIIVMLAHLSICFYILPELRKKISLKKAVILPLMRIGGWMTVSNIVGPLMSNLDRFFIGSIISVSAVAYYNTPMEVVSKAGIISACIAGVLFPAFATSFGHQSNRTAIIFNRGVKYIFLVMFPITLIFVVLAYEGIYLWLGTDFAHHSTRVLQWLAVGVFINSLVQIPFTLIQGAGRPDLTAKLHIIELPFYLFTIWWMIASYGIEGAAIVWVVRAAVDLVVLFLLTQKILSNNTLIFRRMVIIMGAALLTLALASLPENLNIKVVLLLFILLAYILVAWFVLLGPEERAIVQNRFRLNKIS